MGKEIQCSILIHLLTHFSLIAPVALISTSIRNVLYQRFTKIINEGGSPYQFYLKSAKWLSVVGLPIFIIPVFAGPQLFSLFFGNNWSASGDYAAILSATYWVKLVASPLSSIFNSINKIKIASYWQTISTLTIISTLAVGVLLKFNVEQLLIIYAVHEVATYGIYFLLGIYYVKKYQVG